jgi:hypothetical protein
LFFLSGACIRGSLFSFSSTYSLILHKQRTARFVTQVCKDSQTHKINTRFQVSRPSLWDIAPCVLIYSLMPLWTILSHFCWWKINLLPRIRRQFVPPKYMRICTKIHGVKSVNTGISKLN